MLDQLKTDIAKKLNALVRYRERKLISRRFSPQLLTDERAHRFFCDNGYVLLKQAIDPQLVGQLRSLYDSVKDSPGYETTDYYVNSMRFGDTELRKRIVDQTFSILRPGLAQFIHMEKASFPLGGSFCISPPHSSLGCRPHQDPTAVDELDSYAFTIWVPLNDMSVENGCMHVIPGSHRWGNIHRSVTIQWAFDEYMSELWDLSKPLPMQVGDVLCFDVSTIHSSGTNNTDRERLAVNLTTIPKGQAFRNYYPAGQSLFRNQAFQYRIDERYFTEESQFEKPSDRYPVEKVIDLDNYYTLDQIHDLVRQFESETKNP